MCCPTCARLGCGLRHAMANEVTTAPVHEDTGQVQVGSFSPCGCAALRRTAACQARRRRPQEPGGEVTMHKAAPVGLWLGTERGAPLHCGCLPLGHPNIVAGFPLAQMAVHLQMMADAPPPDARRVTAPATVLCPSCDGSCAPRGAQQGRCHQHGCAIASGGMLGTVPAPVKHPTRWHSGSIGDPHGQCIAACLQMMEVVRLQGAPSEADSIGELVWVLDELSGCWWPAELLDPFNLPVDRQLPKGAIAGKCHAVGTGHRPVLSACGPHWVPKDPI